MKEIIVTIGMILLGCLIFNMIAGDGQSLKTASISEINKMAEICEGM